MLERLRKFLILIFSLTIIALGVVYGFPQYREIEDPYAVAVDVYFESSAEINITNAYGNTITIYIARVADNAIIANKTHEICRAVAPYNDFLLGFHGNGTLTIEVYNTNCSIRYNNFVVRPVKVTVVGYRRLQYCLTSGVCEEIILGENPVIYKIRHEECTEDNLGCTIINALKGFFSFLSNLILNVFPDPVKQFFGMIGQFFGMIGYMIAEMVKYLPYVLVAIGMIFTFGLVVYVIEHGFIGIVMYFEDIYELFKKFMELILRVIDLIIPF